MQFWAGLWYGSMILERYTSHASGDRQVSTVRLTAHDLLLHEQTRGTALAETDVL
jgi:hypothetical protein